MTEDRSKAQLDIFSVEDMQGWLKEELRDVEKARELRVKDLTGFVDAYAAGKLTPEEATQRMVQYDRRWGEALPGTGAFPGATDEDILQRIDQSRDEMYGKHSEKFLQRPPTDKKLVR